MAAIDLGGPRTIGGISIDFAWPPFPYPGLRPFTISRASDEALIFYGREEQKDAILGRLRSSQIVFLTGPSGCGKSSLLKVGVIPALEAGFLHQAGYRWRTVQMRPGANPVERMARALASLARQDPVGTAEEVEAILRRSSDIATAVRHVMPDVGVPDSKRSATRLLLAIDQFEEIFGRQIVNPAEVDHFVNMIVRFFQRPLPEKLATGLYIVVTMRTSYIGKCASFPGLAEILNETQYLAPLLKERDLRDAISLPALQYHGEVERDLVDAMVEDMGSGTAYDADHLPLMQHALLWLWQHAWPRSGAVSAPRPDGPSPPRPVRLTYEDYWRGGKLKGILDLHASTNLALLCEGEGGERRAAIAEAMLRRLCIRDVDGRHRRSPARLREIAELARSDGSELCDVIIPGLNGKHGSFLEVRADSSELFDPNPLVDISHEALIRQWKRLREWVDDEAENVRWFRELVAVAQRWERAGRAEGHLRTGAELQVQLGWWEKARPTRQWAERYGLVEGQQARLADWFDLVEEYVEASRQADEREQREREQERIDGEARQLAIRGEEALRRDGSTTAVLIAKEGLESRLGASRLPVLEALAYRALQRMRERKIIDAHEKSVWTVGYLPDGRRLVTFAEGTISVFDDGGERLVARREIPEANFFGARVCRDGRLLVLGRSAGFHVVDATRPDLPTVAAFDLDGANWTGGALSPDGRWAATIGMSGPAKLWDVERGRLVLELEGTSRGWGVAFSGDGRRFATGGTDGQIQVFDFDPERPDPEASVRLRADFTGYPPVICLAFDPTDHDRLLSASLGVGGVLWRIDPDREIERKPAHDMIARAGTDTRRAALYYVKFSPNGTRIAAACDDGVVRLWQAASPDAAPSELRGHHGTVWGVEFSPDGSELISAGSDKTARVWRTDPILQAQPVSGAEARAAGAGSRRLQAGLDPADPGLIRVELPDGQPLPLTRPRSFREPAAAALAAGCARLAVVPTEGCPVLYDLDSPTTPLAILRGPPRRWAEVTFASDPDRVIATTVSGESHQWPVFADRDALLRYVEQWLPTRCGGERVQLTPDLRCSLGLSPIEECAGFLDLED